MQNEWHMPELGPSKSFSLLSMQPEYWLTRDIGKVLYLNSCVRISNKIKIGRGTGCKCHSRISVVISYFWRNVKHVLHSFLSFFVVTFPNRFWTIQNHAIFSCVTCLLLLPIWDKYERGMRKRLVTMKLVSFLVGTCCNAKKSKWVKKINKWITCSATSPQGADIRRHWHQNPNEVQVWTVFSRSQHRANLIFLHRT